MIEDAKKERIAIEVIKTLFSRFENFPEDASNNRNAPFHEAFLRAFSDKLGNRVSDIPFFISLSSWLHGLNTTLGQSFFESVAHILSDGYKKNFTVRGNSLLKVTQIQKRAISNIITELKNNTESPDLNRECNLIFNVSTLPDLEANSFTVDVYLESSTKIIAIELKSVRPNSGEMGGEKQKILQAKAALYNEFPGKEINFYIGFPFDPTSNNPTGHDKVRFLDYLVDGSKYFALDEVLLANELWDFLSGDANTMEQILEIINAIATTEYINKYNYLNETSNSMNDTENYKKLLQKWSIFTEMDLLENNSIILQEIRVNLKAERIFKQPIFKNGEYNQNRYNFLKSLNEEKDRSSYGIQSYRSGY
ncbi:MAG: TdeIII family type II restriction endonuclease [Candidatus Methanoperedenaceae archaeon]|nr:MAG: TdeIII family type II restriction endonuclease [Candidatus Methanoperedenaceae archaeon]